MKRIFSKKVAVLSIATCCAFSLMSFTQESNTELYGVSNAAKIDLTGNSTPEKVQITGLLRVLVRAVTRATPVLDEVTQATATWVRADIVNGQNSKVLADLQMKKLD